MKYLLTILLLSFALQIMAQQKPSPTAVPRLTVLLGGVKNGKVKADDLKRLMDSSLYAKNEKGVVYPVTRFTVNYSFISLHENEETGEIQRTRELRVQEFIDQNRFSDLWKSWIRENIRKGDIMLVKPVIVRLPNGKGLMAPEFRLEVE